MILRSAFEKLFKFRELASRKNKPRAGADDGFDPHEKPFLDHLEDLRHTMMKVITTLSITTILGFAFHKWIFHFVMVPLSLAKMTDDDGNASGTLIEYIHFLVLSPPEILMLSIKVSFFAGLIAAFPLVVYFLGEFILPGLRQQEKKLVIPGIFAGFMLFLVGASFAFFLATPMAMKFFYEFQKERIGFIHPNLTEDREFSPITIDAGQKKVSASAVASSGVEALAEGKSATAEQPVPRVSKADFLPEDQREAIRDYLMELIVIEKGSLLEITYREDIGKLAISTGIREKIEYRIGEYITFVTRLILVFGLSFQMPVVVSILVRLQLLTARVMRATRSFAWVIILVLAAILTPPDVLTLAMLGGPMIILYEICIWIAWSIEKKRERRKRDEEEDERLRLEALYAKPASDLSEEEKAEMHRREIEQYEREHEHLDDDHHGIDDGHDDPDHPKPKLDHDPHSIGYDPGHDESWHDHDEHGNPYHNDPYHSDHSDSDPEDSHHDPHENAEAHRPVQDWPDRENGGESDGDDQQGSLESDHAEPTGDKETPESSSTKTDESAESEPSASDTDHEPCSPSGALVNPNVATLEELASLPGIDEELADHILLYRPFDNFDELLGVPGMDEEILNTLIDRLHLE